MNELASKTEMLNIEFLKEIHNLNNRYGELINKSSVEMLSQIGSVDDLFKCFMDINKMKSWAILEKKVENEDESCQKTNLLALKRKQEPYEANKDLKSSIVESSKDFSTHFSEGGARKIPLFKFVTKRESEQPKQISKHLKLIKGTKSGEHKLKLKLRSDCIRKRIKSLLNSFVINKLNSFLSSINQEVFLFNLPKDFNIDIKVEPNRQLLNSSVLEVFSILPTNPAYVARVEHNKKIMASCTDSQFIELISKKLKDLYKEYLDSTKFKADVASLSRKEGDVYIQTFMKHIDTFLTYFGVN